LFDLVGVFWKVHLIVSLSKAITRAFAGGFAGCATDDVLDLLSWRIQARFQIRRAANHLPHGLSAE
jgi:hypothetical protein